MGRKAKQVEALQHTVEDYQALVPATVYPPGAVVSSPFVTSEAPRPRRLRDRLLRRNGGVSGRSMAIELAAANGLTVYESGNGGTPPAIMEAAGAAAASTEAATAPTRKGFVADIPRGGATEKNQGYSAIGGITDRRTLMHQLQMLYSSCSVASACVDVISRTCSAGGMDVVPEDETKQSTFDPDRVGTEKENVAAAPPGVDKARLLFAYTNPQQNFRQLMRTIFTDLNVYGDAFVEVVWGFGEPIALYNLPCHDMIIEADEHGVVKRYVQLTETQRKAYFQPQEVIHIKFDSPRGGLYGLGPTEKCVHNITTWLFTQGLMKAIMRRGNPPNVAFKWDLNLAEKQVQKFDEQYRTKNLGPDNVGNPVNLMGETNLHEFKPNQIAELLATLNRERDSLCTGYGVPPAKLDIIESGSLGGGTGTSQDKTFKVNTCGPFQELVLEAFTFAILMQGYGIKGWRCKFQEIDWRDDETIERIRIQRVERGAWAVNRYRDEVGEPPVEGGDDPVVVLSRDIVPVRDIAANSLMKLGLVPESPLPAIGSQQTPVARPGTPGAKPEGSPAPPPPKVAPTNGKDPAAQMRDARAATRAAHEIGIPISEYELYEQFKAELIARQEAALAELRDEDDS